MTKPAFLLSYKTPIRNSWEAISKALSPASTRIYASGHTWRMMSLTAEAQVLEREVGRQALADGIYGYLWGRVAMVDNTLEDGAFRFGDDQGKDLGSLAFGAESAPWDYIFTPGEA